MSGSNSFGSAEAAELTDLEAGRLAQQIAAERFLPISARHYEAYLSRVGRPSMTGSYDRSDLEPIWTALFMEAIVEVEIIRDLNLIRRLQQDGKRVLQVRYGDRPVVPTPPLVSRQ